MRKTSHFVTKFLGLSFVVLGIIFLLGFWTNDKNLRGLKIFFGDASFLLGPVCFLIAYFLSRHRFKAALYTVFLLPLGAIMMPNFHLNGGYFWKLSKKIS